MTADEIKKTYSMNDILSRYGISVRHGMCSCPFHGADRHPSMQVFKDGFKCHTCNEHGDIFDFVMLKEQCSFKDAFISLGGTYEHKDTKTKQKLTLKRFDRQKKRKERVVSGEREFKLFLSDTITKCQQLIQNTEPFSDEWCAAQNALPWLLYSWELKYINSEEINEPDVIRVCRKIERI